MALISPPAKPGGGGPAAQVVTPAGRREALNGSSAGSRRWLDPERNRTNAAAVLDGNGRPLALRQRLARIVPDHQGKPVLGRLGPAAERRLQAGLGLVDVRPRGAAPLRPCWTAAGRGALG